MNIGGLRPGNWNIFSSASQVSNAPVNFDRIQQSGFKGNASTALSNALAATRGLSPLDAFANVQQSTLAGKLYAAVNGNREPSLNDIKFKVDKDFRCAEEGARNKKIDSSQFGPASIKERYDDEMIKSKGNQERGIRKLCEENPNEIRTLLDSIINTTNNDQRYGLQRVFSNYTLGNDRDNPRHNNNRYSGAFRARVLLFEAKNYVNTKLRSDSVAPNDVRDLVGKLMTINKDLGLVMPDVNTIGAPLSDADIRQQAFTIILLSVQKNKISNVLASFAGALDRDKMPTWVVDRLSNQYQGVTGFKDLFKGVAPPRELAGKPAATPDVSGGQVPTPGFAPDSPNVAHWAIQKSENFEPSAPPEQPESVVVAVPVGQYSSDYRIPVVTAVPFDYNTLPSPPTGGAEISYPPVPTYIPNAKGNQNDPMIIS